MKDVFGLSISEGSISNLLQRTARKTSPIYEHIQAELQTATYVGSDETGAKINGKNAWVWVWQNAKNTFLKVSPSREPNGGRDFPGWTASSYYRFRSLNPAARKSLSANRKESLPARVPTESFVDPTPRPRAIS